MRGILPTASLTNIAYKFGLPKWNERFDGGSQPHRGADERGFRFRVVSEKVCYERLGRLARACVSSARSDEIGEEDFSLLAICSARRALTAAA
jgi:hypothetical protein